MSLFDFLVASAILQGGFVVGAAIGMWLYFFRKTLTGAVKWHFATIVASYVLVTIGTVITISRGVYAITDFWYWLVFVGYLTGDISLLYLFRYQLDRAIREKLLKQLEDEKEKRYKEVLERVNARREGVSDRDVVPPESEEP